MELRRRKPLSYDLRRRKFEGRTDDSKNGDSLTSKYMPSYKYWMKILYEGGREQASCYRTKKDALAAYDLAKSKAGTLI